MNDARTAKERLRELFAGQVECAFYSKLGLADPELVAYLTSLLVRFVHVDAIFPADKSATRRIEGVMRLFEKLDRRPETGKTRWVRDMYRYIGDVALFWAGLYPEAVSLHLGGSSGQNKLTGYGRRSYLRAAQMSRSDGDLPPRRLLQRLSTHFELCVRGLGLVRRQWRPERVRFSSRPMLTRAETTD